MRSAVFLALCLVVSLALPAEAMQFRSGDEVVIPQGTTIPDDLYVAAGTVRIDGTIQGDLVVAGGDVRVSGKVGRDVLAAGGTLDLSGPVGGSVRAAGGKVSLSGKVGTDAVVAGGQIRQQGDSVLGRDGAFTGGEVTLRGRLPGHLWAAGRDVTLDGRSGAADVKAEHLVLTPNARIQGRLDYATTASPDIRPGAVIAGPVSAHALARGAEKPRGPHVGWWFGLLAAALVCGLALVGLLPRATEGEIAEIRRRPGWALLLGVGVVLLGPVAIVILMVTVLGIPLALLALAAYLVALPLGWLFAATALGDLLLRTRVEISRRFGRLLLEMAVGALILHLIHLIPVLGWLIGWLATCLGVGAGLFALGRSQGAEAPEQPLVGPEGLQG